jgi:arginine N-succinyltransferase
MTELRRQPDSPEQPPNQTQKGMGCLKIGLLMLLTIVMSVGLTLWLLTTYMFPKAFKPVDLDSREEIVLSSKLR